MDIHHVFPRAWCEANEIKRSAYDTVVNKTPLFYKSNRIIGGSAPSQYLARLLKEKAIETAVQQDEIIDSHEIDPTLLRADDFHGFYAARREALLKLIERAMVKVAFREGAPPPETTLGMIDDLDEEQEDDILEDTPELAA